MLTMVPALPRRNQKRSGTPEVFNPQRKRREARGLKLHFSERCVEYIERSRGTRECSLRRTLQQLARGHEIKTRRQQSQLFT